MLQLIHTRHEWQRMAQVTLRPAQILAQQTSTTSTTTACSTNEGCSFETGFWSTLFKPEGILSTHQDPGCVTFPAPPHTVSCSHPRAYSFLWDKVGFGLTDCASLKCIQRPRSDQAFPANQVSPAFQQHLEDRKGVTITNRQCGHQLALYPILALLLLCLCQSCTRRSPSIDGCYMNNQTCQFQKQPFHSSTHPFPTSFNFVSLNSGANVLAHISQHNNSEYLKEPTKT